MKRLITLFLFLSFSVLLFASEYVYVTPEGKKYHRKGCRYLGETAEKILLEEAVKKGYTPCRVCSPPLLSEDHTDFSENTDRQVSQDFFSVSRVEGIKDKDTVAVFNVLHLGWNNQKDIAQLAKAVAYFDVTGLLEVMNEEGLTNLLQKLESETGEDWSCLISPQKTGRSRYREYYAFIYNQNVELKEVWGFYSESDDEFEREPFAADFKIGKFDFTFVIQHSIYGDSVGMRRDEAELGDEVYLYFQWVNGEENDVFYGGDFNLPADDRAFQGIMSVDQMKIAISPDEKTTVGKKGFVSAYDQIFYSKYSENEVTGAGKLNLIGGDFVNYRTFVSDHLPVYLILDASADDDD